MTSTEADVPAPTWRPFVDGRLLDRLDACEAQFLLFHRLYPGGTEVTVDEAVRAANHFDWQWAAAVLLDGAGHREWCVRTQAKNYLPVLQVLQVQARAFAELAPEHWRYRGYTS